MSIQEIQDYCQSLPNTEKAMPCGENLRERYNAISPAYHICEKHWNDIFIEGTFPNDMIEEWIKESYDLVKTELPNLAYSRI